MSLIFNKPPVIEAICQFQFVPAAQKPLDSTLPGLMYARIREEFPISEEQPGLQFQFNMSGATQPQVSPVPNRVFFKRKDNSAVLQIGQNLLAINCLPPYPNWDVFRAMILDNLRIYQEIAQPEMLVGAELRYINRIELPFMEPGEGVNIPDYVTAYPHMPEALLKTTGLRFVQRVEIGIPELRGMLVIQSATVEALQESQTGVMQGGIILDLSFTYQDQVQLTLTDAAAWIEAAHTEVERAFFACITETARESFGEQHNV